MTDARYPIGEFRSRAIYTPAERAVFLTELAQLPGQLRAAVAGLHDAQLDTPYRTGGWTVRQVVHHVPDSHLNAYTRTKLALTEAGPAIKPYDEGAWAQLPDSRLPVEVSLRLLDALHERWVALLQGLPEEAWSRAFIHPDLERQGEGLGRVTLEQALASYAWHGRHHVAHVTVRREQLGW